MDEEAGLKALLAAAFVFATAVAVRTARQAVRRHGGSVNQLAHDVPGLLVVRAALGLVFYAALGAWYVWPAYGRWMYIPIPMALRWTAGVLLLPVLALFAASFRALGVHYRGGVGLYPDHVLVTTGPYRYLRHPLYVTFVLLMALVLVLSANWLLGAAGLLLVLSIAVARVPIEERQLRERFGPAWDAYRARTGRLFPRV